MDFVQKINKLREQIQQVNEELNWLDGAPLPKDEFKARVVAWVDHMASSLKDAEGSLASFRRPDVDSRNSKMLNISSRIHVHGGEHSTVAPFEVSLAPQLAWLFGDQIKEVLLTKVDAMDYVPGLPMAERPERRKQLLQNRRVLEEKEEALICESEEAQLPVFRREDADPAVVLGYDPDGEMGIEGTRMAYASGAAQSTTPAVRQAIGQAVIPLALPR
ncbi:MAG: hypothetical protein KIG98_02385 [Comamonas sp.]|nr:hypothetical protein [Comamonas sp.]